MLIFLVRVVVAVGLGAVATGGDVLSLVWLAALKAGEVNPVNKTTSNKHANSLFMSTPVKM